LGLARTLAIAAVVWLLVLASAVLARQHERNPMWTTVVYAAASKICHQRPERSFFSAGVQWPVCGRCSGLYLAAPIGAAIALRSRQRSLSSTRARWLVLVAALPTLTTAGIEVAGLAHVTNIARALAALPLGAAIAWVVMRAVVID
jgi:uncharacterized membrane protein